MSSSTGRHSSCEAVATRGINSNSNSRAMMIFLFLRNILSNEMLEAVCTAVCDVLPRDVVMAVQPVIFGVAKRHTVAYFAVVHLLWFGLLWAGWFSLLLPPLPSLCDSYVLTPTLEWISFNLSCTCSLSSFGETQLFVICSVLWVEVGDERMYKRINTTLEYHHLLTTSTTIHPSCLGPFAQVRL